MLISKQRRFIFAANTKTASTAIEEALEPHANRRLKGSPRRKHLPLARVEAALPQMFAKTPFHRFFRFGVMREPVDWIVSWFRYRKQQRVEDPLPDTMTFAEFWERGDWNIRRADGSPYLQSDIFAAADGTCLADVILPYHDVEPGLRAICETLDIPFDGLPRRNVSPARIAAPEIDAAMTETLRAHYAADYALWERLEALNADGMARLRADRAGARSPGQSAP